MDSNIKNLLNQEIIEQIIKNSELKNYIDVNKFSQNEIDGYFSKSIEIIQSKPELMKRFIDESTTYDKTKYHKENLITHLYCVGWICTLFAEKYNLEAEFAFKLGFFHDIGKPWAKKLIQTKKKIISYHKGHAQIGENICWELGLDKKICWCVSYHMCSCCHENKSKEHWEYNAALQCIGLYGIKNEHMNLENKIKFITEYANSLACLMIADDLGRLGDVDKNYLKVIEHSDNWLDWFKTYISSDFNPVKSSVKILGSLHSDNSIIIQMYGHSGFGKSTACKNIMDRLDEFGIVWEYAERDKSYYNVYAEANSMDIMDVMKNIEYKDVYEYVQLNDLKKQVQLDWVNQLNQILDSDSKVKIIDSVQLMYPSAWESTLLTLNPDAYSVWKSSIKIGYYGFPQSLYGRNFIPKTGKYELIPKPVGDGLSWANINSELDEGQKFNPDLIDIGYGGTEFIINSIFNYNSWSKLCAPEKQVHLINILDEITDKTKLTSKYIQDYVSGQFPPGIIQSNEEYNYFSHRIIRFTYKDGMQIFHGPSRDYRGETLLFDSSELKYYIGRVSLPVFPDYNDLRKDPGIQNILANNTCGEFHIVPKFDGSLFVLSLIKANTPEHVIISKLIHLISPESYYINDVGIWCFGSKGCMFAKNQYGDKGALNRILNSIKASYNSVDNFISMVCEEIKTNMFGDIYKNISLCFEAIDSNPTDELTVDYKRSFCPFLCWVVWDGEKKNIILPTKSNITYLNPIAEITTVNSWDKVIEFKEQAHLRLLNGSETDEPEGYVVWLGNSNLGIKLKHMEYYVAHKPYSKKNMEMAKKIEFDPEYSKLKLRLLKFKPKPPIKDLVEKNINYIIDLFFDNYNYLNSKKKWAIRWKNDKLLEELNNILEQIENDIVIYYPQFKNSIQNKGFSIAIDYFEKRNDWKEYFFTKYLKI